MREPKLDLELLRSDVEHGYDSEKAWKVEPDWEYNAGQVLTPNDLFLAVGLVTPLPCACAQATVIWCEDAYGLAAYMKYGLIKNTALALLEIFPDNAAKLSTLSIVDDLSGRGGEYEVFRAELLREYRLIELALAGPEEALLETLKGCLLSYDAFFRNQNFTFGVKLLEGIDAVTAFFADEEASFFFGEAEEWVEDVKKACREGIPAVNGRI